MPKSESVETRALALRAMDEAGVRAALADKSNLVVAKAANLIGQRGWSACTQALAAAYPRWEKNDKGCLAKTAIVRALYELAASDEPLFLHAVRCVQKEAAWGGSTDAAAELRGWGATALVRMGSRRGVEETLRLLVDHDIVARTMGVRAIAYAATEDARMLLRLKALTGDPEPAVLGECLSALLRAWPDKNEPFVGEFIEAGGEWAEAACAALGEARTSQAFAVLRQAYDASIEPARRRIVIAALGKMRREEAVSFLIDVIQDGATGDACAAVEAMAAHKAEPAARQRVTDAVETRQNASITAAWCQAFGAKSLP